MRRVMSLAIGDRLRFVLAAVATAAASFAALLFGVAIASAGTSELRPVSDHIRGWASVRSSAAWSALDDSVTKGQPVRGGDRISARSGGKIAAVNLSQPAIPAAETPVRLAAHFYAKTGRRTKVHVQLRSGNALLARTSLKRGSRASWRSLGTSDLDAVDLSRLRLRFRTSKRRTAQVRAAYASLETRPVGEEPPPSSRADVSVFGSTTTIRPDHATPAGGSNDADLVAARNEFESFQVVTKASEGAIDGLDVELAGALAGPGGASIAPSNVTLYREEYYEVSAADGKPRSSRQGAEGRWPDALIPERDPYYGEDRAAFPIDVARGDKETAWVDVFVPPGATPGSYTGELRLSDSSGQLDTVPIRVEVINFAMPSTSSLRSAFLMTPPGYFPCKAHRATDWCYPEDERNWKLDYLYARAALENRITIPNAMPGPFQAAPTSPHFEEYMLPLIEGTDTGGIDGTLAPRLGGAELTSVTAMWQCVVEAGCLEDWRSIARANGFEDKFFAYVCDEPFDENTPEYWNDWRDCSRNARTANEAWPGVPTLVTSTIQSANKAQSDGKIDVNRDIDILSAPLNYMANRPGNPQVGNQRPAYNSFVANDEDGENEAWTYGYCAQYSCDELEAPYFDGWPAYTIDQPASQARAMGWMAYRYDLSGELYYNTTESLGTAFDDQYTWGGNGSGTLFYPGSPNGYGGSPAIGGQHDIPLESMRLKRIRDGREDYELLHALDQRGQAAEASSILTGLVGPADTAMFSNDVSQSAIDATRCELMRALDPSAC